MSQTKLFRTKEGKIVRRAVSEVDAKSLQKMRDTVAFIAIKGGPKGYQATIQKPSIMTNPSMWKADQEAYKLLTTPYEYSDELHDALQKVFKHSHFSVSASVRSAALPTVSLEEQRDALLANKPRVRQVENLWIVEVYSPFTKRYIVSEEWPDKKRAQEGLKAELKAHQRLVATLEDAVKSEPK